VAYIPLGEGVGHVPTVDERRLTRQGLGLPAEAVLVGVYGALTDAKRIPQILRAFARTHRLNPVTHLLLCGPSGPEAWKSRAEEIGIPSDSVTCVDAPNDETFDAAIATADVTLHLRWPTSLETSGPWLRALSAGRATVTTELEHQAHVPALDPRTWRPWTTGPEAPVTVAIDILDEDHSLALALRRLVVDEPLRTRLGAAARAHWEREHSVPMMLDGYERAIARAQIDPSVT
jgi:glycosyltransferase involved in cell wall biosynthesis